MANRESNSGVLYKGFAYENHHSNVSQWSNISINDVELVKTERFTYQCAGEDDYAKYLHRESSRYEEVKVTMLVADGKRV